MVITEFLPWNNLFTFIITYLVIMVAIVQWKKDTSIANFTWGWGVMLLSLFFWFHLEPLIIEPSALNETGRQTLITILTTLWGLRMLVHLYMRYTGKDPRYIQWHKEGMPALIFNIAYIFTLQLLLLIIMVLPIFAVYFMRTSASLGILDLIGTLLWCIGFFFESVGDYQLYKFTQNPNNRGKVMRYGLWKYTRHPNYFGEICLQWGIYIIAYSQFRIFVFDPHAIYITKYILLISPLTITILLRYITGVPWVEKVFDNNAEYQEYKKRTNTLIPWFPKKEYVI